MEFAPGARAVSAASEKRACIRERGNIVYEYMSPPMQDNRFHSLLTSNVVTLVIWAAFLVAPPPISLTVIAAS